mgnify:CR=1 FL=1
MATKRWKLKPKGSNWGEFGEDDQLGRLNLITPEKVRQGIAEVREGRTFCLSLPLDRPGGNALNPRRHPPVLRPTLRGEAVNFLASDGAAPDVLCDDLVIMHLQYSTQWDAFSHVGGRFDVDGDGVDEHVFYNGFRAGQDITGPSDPQDAGVRSGMKGESTSRAAKLGVENAAVHGMQGRAVMIDLRAHLGDGRTYVGYEDLMRVMEADGVEVDVYNLHGEAGGSDVDQQLQADGYQQLAAYIEANSEGRAIVLAGDTNLHTDEPPEDAQDAQDVEIWAEFLETTGLTDACEPTDCATPGDIDKGAFRSGGGVEIAAVTHQYESEIFVDEAGEDLSDHPALEVVFSWSQE